MGLSATSIIAAPLLHVMNDDSPEIHKVLIWLNDDGPAPASRVHTIADSILSGAELIGGRVGPRYLVALLTAKSIRELIRLDRSSGTSSIYQVWPDLPIHAQGGLNV